MSSSESPTGRQSTCRASSFAFYVSLVIVPWLWANTMPMALIAVAYMRARQARLPEAIQHSFGYVVELLSHAGPVAAFYVALGNLAAFGIVIVLCWCLTYVWAANRIYCVLLCALIVPTVVEWRKRMPIHEMMYAVDDSWRRFIQAEVPDNSIRHIPPFVDVAHVPYHLMHSWEMLLWSYDPWGLLAIPAAMIVAMLIFKPGARYYLRRGHCPKCHYDLRGKTDAGCPECGWNRPAAAGESDSSG